MSLAMTSRIARDGVRSIGFRTAAAFAQDDNNAEYDAEQARQLKIRISRSASSKSSSRKTPARKMNIKASRKNNAIRKRRIV
jgi:hypothetical protein